MNTITGRCVYTIPRSYVQYWEYIYTASELASMQYSCMAHHAGSYSSMSSFHTGSKVAFLESVIAMSVT